MLVKAKRAIAKAIRIAVDQALVRLLPITQQQNAEMVRALRSAVAASEEHGMTVVTRLSDSTTATEARLTARMDALTATMQEIKAELAKTRASVDRVSVSEQNALNAVARLSEGLAATEDRLATNMNGLAASVHDIRTDLGKVRAGIDHMTSADDRMVSGLDGLAASVHDIRTDLAKVRTGFDRLGSLDQTYAGLAQAAADSRHAILTRIAELEHQLSEARLTLDGKTFELSNAVAHATGRTDIVGVELSNMIATLQNAVADMSGRLDSNRAEPAHAAYNGKTAELERLLGEIRLMLESRTFELQNAVAHATGRTDTIGVEISNLVITLTNATKHVGSVVENVEVRLAHLLGERFTELTAEDVGRLLRIEAGLERGARQGDAMNAREAAPAPLPDLTFETALERARSDFPRQFDDWFTRLKTIEDAIAVTRVGNLAHPADPYSRAFKSFVDLHACGLVLDVGCGTMGRPVYLADLPADRLQGLEPLVLQEPFDFPVCRGIGEYLPWRDASFDTVVSATAIDHSLSLERALDELKRVLKPGGSVLMWVGSNVGALPFEPDSPDYQPADRFHLFHIDRNWFEPLLERHFTIEDRVVLWTPSHEHVFYKLGVQSGDRNA